MRFKIELGELVRKLSSVRLHSKTLQIVECTEQQCHVLFFFFVLFETRSFTLRTGHFVLDNTLLCKGFRSKYGIVTYTGP
jgi:hypothetical protein